MTGAIDHQLDQGFPPPVEVFNPDGRAPVLLVCEHAARSMPDHVAGLGLPAPLRDSHIAWDPGAGAVTRAMARSLGAPALLGTLSRLLYDLNRPPRADDAIPRRSEIHAIPGNHSLSETAREARISGIYRPFSLELAGRIAAARVVPALVTIHSFTPVYKGSVRETEIGILHDDDSRLADAMLALAPGQTEFRVARNAPYGPADGVTHTLRAHALPGGLLNVMIEIRNDLIATRRDQGSMADLLAAWLTAALHLCLGDRPCPA